MPIRTMRGVEPQSGSFAPAKLDFSEAAIGLRRFSAGLRTVTAVLCLLLLIADSATHALVLALLVCYSLWSVVVFMRADQASVGRWDLLHYWVDVSWAVVLLQFRLEGGELLVLTCIQPVVLASILYGTYHGVLLGCFVAVGLTLRAFGTALDMRWLLSSVGMLALGPIAALLARPLGDLRLRLALTTRIETEADPRRGIAALGSALVECLQGATSASVIALVMPGLDRAPALLRTPQDGIFQASLAVQRQLEALLRRLPDTALASKSAPGRLAAWFSKASTHQDPDATQALAELSGLLDIGQLVVLPLRLRGRDHGHLLLGYHDDDTDLWSPGSLTLLLPLLVHLIEKAELVDELQAETAAHERARIGRDLHDSAIQPYLALKFAVESLAMRADNDNPLQAELQSLAEQVHGEVAVLRELISQLRSGEPHGDDALLPAVRRQILRFAQLSGIQVHLDGPADLRCTRALAGSVFHLVNEALNNVRKHTLACNVWITVENRVDTIRLAIRDDGGTVQGAALPAFQPRSLTERVQELGGTLHIGRISQLDTEIEIVIPV